jgi:hypothetical protein
MDPGRRTDLRSLCRSKSGAQQRMLGFVVQVPATVLPCSAFFFLNFQFLKTHSNQPHTLYMYVLPSSGSQVEVTEMEP